MNIFTPRFTITSRMTAAITSIERARGFLEAARATTGAQIGTVNLSRQTHGLQAPRRVGLRHGVCQLALLTRG